MGPIYSYSPSAKSLPVPPDLISYWTPLTFCWITSGSLWTPTPINLPTFHSHLLLSTDYNSHIPTHLMLDQNCTSFLILTSSLSMYTVTSVCLFFSLQYRDLHPLWFYHPLFILVTIKSLPFEIKACWASFESLEDFYIPQTQNKRRVEICAKWTQFVVWVPQNCWNRGCDHASLNEIKP